MNNASLLLQFWACIDDVISEVPSASDLSPLFQLLY